MGAINDPNRENLNKLKWEEKEKRYVYKPLCFSPTVSKKPLETLLELYTSNVQLP